MAVPQRTEAETKFLSIAEKILEGVYEYAYDAGVASTEEYGYSLFSLPDEYELLDRLKAAGLKIVRA